MQLPIDIIIAPKEQFVQILADVKNAAVLDVTPDVGVSIDDVVTIVAVHRQAIDDRQAWWKIRRQVYAHYATHAEISVRTLALLPDDVRDEIAGFDEEHVNSVAASWAAQDDATPSNAEQAMHSLAALVCDCSKACGESKGLFLRASQPPNAFEAAFSKLEGKQLANFRRAFDKWDGIKQHEAHQKYNYYTSEGVADCLNQVLRDLTRRKTAKVNLKTDQRTITRHIKKRVKEYQKNPSPSLGNPDDPITLISLMFDIEYEGYAELSFDTRLDAAQNLDWEHMEDYLEFEHWYEGCVRVGCDELPLKVTLHDGSKVVVPADDDADDYERYIGEMLRDTMVQARDSGEFAKLPLADKCVMWVGGTHANYSWPESEHLEDEGRVN